MKTFKKISWVWLLLAVVGLVSVYATSKVSAATPNSVNDPTNGQQYTLAWQDRSTIIFTATGGSVPVANIINLYDNNWDSNWDYTFSIDGSCTVDVNGFGSSIVGIGDSKGKVWDQADSVGDITVSRLEGGSCKKTVNKAPISISKWQNAEISFRATAEDEITSNDKNNPLVFNSPRLQSDGSTRYYRTDEAGNKCQDIISVFPDGSMKLFEQDSNKDNTSGVASPVTDGCYLEWTTSNIPLHVNSFDSSYLSNFSMPLENADVLKKPASVQDGNGSSGTGASGAAGGIQKGDPCNSGSDCKNGVCQADNGDCANGSCQQGFTSFFAFFVCPALDMIDGIINAAYGQVENQLCFDTGPTSSTGGVNCSTTQSIGNNVKNAWNIFKNIASALMVIVLLVMVISQAIGGGPFDAYTIRKVLPKIVAAVIIMQLSYVLIKYAIDLSNDAGKAIGKIMMAPFGGPNNMNLADMVGRAVKAAAGDKTSTTGFITQTSFDLFSSIAAIGAFYFAIPALPILGLYVVVGVFVAFFVLILRKLLIIMLLILAPVAFIAWVLPGTERYWKMWRENMSKLLVMFPLVMGMLAAGRIFAYITSTAGNGASMFNPHIAVAHLGPLPVPYVASATGFADIAIIILAYFAPYFLLPKTFQWGGQLLGAAGKTVENYANKGAEPAKKLFKNREESYRAERRRKSALRVSRNEPFKWYAPWQKPVDLLKSGKLDPTLGRPGITIAGRQIISPSRRRESAITKYVAQGAEAEQQELKEADLRLNLLFNQVDEHDELARAYASGDESYEYTTHDGRTHRIGRISEAERQAGLNAVAKFGGGRNFRFLDQEIAQMREHGSTEERRIAKNFLDTNASTLTGKMKHFYYGAERDNAIHAEVGSMSENSFVGMEGAEMEAILESLTQRIAAGGPAGVTATQDLQRVLTFYQAAIDNENIKPNITSGVSQAVEALVRGHNLAEINASRTLFGLDGIDPAAAGNPAIAPLAAALNPRHDDFGHVT